MNKGKAKSVVAPFRIPVTVGRISRKDLPIAAGMIRVSDLVFRYRIDRRDAMGRTGYQREPSPARVTKLAEALRLNRVDLPTAILLNVRNFDKATQLIPEGGQVFLTLADDDALWVVDGQHRVEALKKLYESDSNRWETFEIPFVAMLGADQFLEMEEFYVVNSNAKSVPTALAYDILTQRAETNPEIMDELEERGKAWITKAQDVARLMAETSLWRGRIRFANEPADATTISSAGLVNSLQPVLNLSFMDRLPTDAQVRVLEAYWEGIRRVLPDIFREPENYTLQKGLGVYLMHRLFLDVLDILRTRGLTVTDPEAHRDILQEALETLQEDVDGRTVAGADFWKSGQDGAAGAYSSNAGRRVLLAKIRRRLPQIELA